MSKKSVSYTIVAAVVAIIICLAVFNRDASQGKKLRIAGNLPLTGPVAAFSGNYPKGFIMGIDDACEKYGVDRKSIVVDFQDNQAKPADATTVFNQQATKGFDVYIVGTSEPASAVTPQLSSRHNSPTFLVAFDAYATKNDTNFFRILPNYKVESPLWIEFARKSNAKKIFTITLNISSIEEQYAENICPVLIEDGIEIVREKFDFSTTDFRSIALKVREANPDLIFITGFSFQLQLAINALRELDLVKDRNVMTTIDLVDFFPASSFDKSFEGIVFPCPFYEIPNKTKDADAFKAAFNKKHGVSPTYIEAYAYDTAYLLIHTLKEYGKISSETLSKSTFDGVTGTVQFDQERDVATSIQLVTVRDGKIIAIFEGN